MSSWIGRLVKTLNESTTRRGVVVEESLDYVLVRFGRGPDMIEKVYAKNEVQFID